MGSDDVVHLAWVILAVVLVCAEIFVPGFVLLPFGLGAGVAAIVGFAGAGFGWQLGAFVVSSALFFAALRPLARRLNQVADPPGVGANRLLGESGVVLDRLGPDDPGLVRVDREQWRADSADGRVLDVGARVVVVEVKGTRVLVRAADPSTDPSSTGAPTV